MSHRYVQSLILFFARFYSKAVFLSFLILQFVSNLFPRYAHAESLHSAFLAAWSRDPTAQSASVDANAAQKTADATKSWFPNGPIINGEYMDDHFIGSNLGYTTYQVTVMVPLWLPGQGTATVKNALADEEVAKSRMAVSRLQTGVQVLECAASANLLEREINVLETSDDILKHIVSEMKRAISVGESPNTDFEAAAAEELDVAARLDDTQQKLDVAQDQLESLTGDRSVPDLMLIDAKMLVNQHINLDPDKDPRVLLAKSIRKSAQAGYEVASHSYIPAPEVGLMVSKQGQYGSPWDTQVGAQFSIALPSAARNTPIKMNAIRAIGAADRDVTIAERNVANEYSEIRSQLTVALDRIQHTRDADLLLNRRTIFLEHSWKIGETPLTDYLRARQLSLNAHLRFQQAEITWRTAIVRLALMSGATI